MVESLPLPPWDRPSIIEQSVRMYEPKHGQSRQPGVYWRVHTRIPEDFMLIQMCSLLTVIFIAGVFL